MSGTSARPAGMRTVSMRNLRAHKVRLVLTIVSVLLGTAFVAGSLVFTDTLRHSFDSIFKTSDKGIDAQVHDRDDFGAGVPLSELDTIAAVPGVHAVQAQVSGSLVVVDPSGKKVDTGGAPSDGGAWAPNDPVQVPPTLTAGRAPTHTGEVAINTGAMSKYHLAVGDLVKVVVQNSAVHTARIVGAYRVSYDTGGYLGALFSRQQASRKSVTGESSQ